MKKRGTLIVIEGTDGAGKATQTRRLANTLRRMGKPVRTISFPQYGEASAAPIEAYLRGEYGPLSSLTSHQASLLYAIDRVAARAKIERWLQEGCFVIADRYVTSNLAHQGAKISNRTARQRFWQWSVDLEYRLLQIPRPDHTVVLFVPTTLTRQLNAKKHNRAYLKSKRDIAENDSHHQRQASSVYQELAQFFPGMTVINCAPRGELLSIPVVHQLVLSALNTTLRSKAK